MKKIITGISLLSALIAAPTFAADCKQFDGTYFIQSDRSAMIEYETYSFSADCTKVTYSTGAILSDGSISIDALEPHGQKYITDTVSIIDKNNFIYQDAYGETEFKLLANGDMVRDGDTVLMSRANFLQRLALSLGVTIKENN